MGKNKTDATKIMKFFRKKREQRKLEMMQYAGTTPETSNQINNSATHIDPTKKEVRKYKKDNESFGARQARLSGRIG